MGESKRLKQESALNPRSQNLLKKKGIDALVNDSLVNTVWTIGKTIFLRTKPVAHIALRLSRRWRFELLVRVHLSTLG